MYRCPPGRPSFDKHTDCDIEKKTNLRHRVFQESLCPLLFSMRLFGLHFENRPDSMTPDVYEEYKILTRRFKAENDKGSSETHASRYGWCLANKSKIYSTSVLILMWVQFFRILSAFTSGDTMTVIVTKLVFVNYTFKCALMFTSYYRASYRGMLEKTLQKFPEISDSEINIGKHVILYTAFAWIVTISNTIFLAYMTLYLFNSATDSLLALSTRRSTIVAPELSLPWGFSSSCLTFTWTPVGHSLQRLPLQ